MSKKKKEYTPHERVNKLAQKYAWSVKVRDDVLALCRSVYIEGSNDCFKSINK